MESATNLTTNASTGNGQTFTQFYKEPFGFQLARLVLEVVIFVLGVLGNVLVCTVVVREKLYRSLAYCLILNLAIADLGLLVFSLPFALLRTEDVSWPFGEFTCKVLYPVSDVFPAVSIASVTAIAVYRYRGIVTGRSSLEPRRAVKEAQIVISLIWVCSFVLFVVPLFFAMKFVEQDGRVHCFPQFTNDLYFKLYQAEAVLLTYALPLAIILFTYIAIRGRLRESIDLHSRMRKESGTSVRSQDDKTLKALRIISPVVLVFAITMLPYNVFRVVDIFADTSNFEYLLLFFKLCVLFFVGNSSANPLIYALVSDEFRKAFGWHIRHCSSSETEGKLFSLPERLTTFRSNLKRSMMLSRTSTPKGEQRPPSEVFL